MVIEKKLYQVTIDELPVIGGFVYNSFMGDAGDFVPYTDFADPFPTNYANKLKEVELAVSPVIIRNKMKVVTFTLLTDMYGLRDKLNKAVFCIYNINGQVVSEQKTEVNKGIQKYKLSTINLKDGLYFFRIIGENKLNYCSKLIKQ